MSDGETKGRVRRIAIALGGEAPDAQALERIARLAAGMRAEIAGLFVEDIELLHLAALPFAAEFSRFTQRHRRLEAAELERQLRVQAAAAQRALAAAAERAGVRWSFRVSRGSVAALLLQAVTEVDLLALGAARRAWVGESDFGIAAESAARRALRVEPPGRPVVVVCDETSAGKRALEVARDLADADSRPLTVILIAPDQAGVEQVRAQAAEVIGERAARYQRSVDPTARDLMSSLRSQNAAIAVLPAGKPVLEASAFKLLRAGLTCPALLVR